MKKALLLLAGLFVFVHSEAQDRAMVPAKLANRPAAVPKKLRGDEITTSSASPNITRTAKTATITSDLFPETQIGHTTYDLQTNSSICNRIVLNDDGTLAAVWTNSSTGSNSNGFPDRGTGYNYFNGTQWAAIPTARIESKRVGWPNIVNLNNGKEYVIAHNTADTKLQLTSRSAKGTGAWTEDLNTLVSPSISGNWWPRMVKGGTNGNSIHAISITYPTGAGGVMIHGQDGALCYSRSQDGGATWDRINVIIPQIDSSNYFGFSADDYAIDAKDSVVAIVSGGNVHDLFLLKSTDNGNTWVKTVIDTFPIHNYIDTTMISDINGDGVADTIVVSDGSVSVLLDENHKAHVFSGMTRMLDTANSAHASYFPGYDALLYWNENMPIDSAKVIATALDYNHDGIINLPTGGGNFPFGTYGTGLASFPSSGIDANNTIYLAYSSIVEFDSIANNVDQNGHLFRHTYVKKSTDHGMTWSLPSDIYTDAFTEVVFASVARKVDANVHLVYQRDDVAGNSLQGSPPGSTDPGNTHGDIIAVAVPVTAVGTINTGINNITEQNYAVGMYPNPAADKVTLTFALTQPERIKVIVYNMFGQNMGTFMNENQMAGMHNLTINTTGYAKGIYFVNTIVGNSSNTRKLVIE